MVFLIEGSPETHGSGGAAGTDTTSGSTSKSSTLPETSTQRGSGNEEIDISEASLPGRVGEKKGEGSRKSGSGDCGSNSRKGPQMATHASNEAVVSHKRKASEYDSNSEG